MKTFSDELSRAVLQTVAYADIFDYPLTAHEIHRYLTGVRASVEEVQEMLEEDRVVLRVGNYFTLAGREEIVSTRIERETRSRKLLPHAIQYGRILGALPYVRMVALTGSLAVLNISTGQDFDYMIVTASGHLWTARALAVTFGRMMRPFGSRICVNLLVSENALFWPQHDLYSAREMCQMIPITGIDMYRRLRAANPWTEFFLPNSSMSRPSTGQLSGDRKKNRIQTLLEMPLHRESARPLEQWAMKFQLDLIMRRSGAGDETNFSLDICQANFDHHGNWTRQAFQQRLKKLGVEAPLPLEQGVWAV
ncbi:MAG TPA: hypothetical protein VJ821_05135 [Anaerolineales bacterium]|nr:hypothetical protein [Anaerolineales bacterium]